MTTAQVVETSVTVNNNSPIEDYVHPDDQTQPFEMTPGFKPFTAVRLISIICERTLQLHFLHLHVIHVQSTTGISNRDTFGTSPDCLF